MSDLLRDRLTLVWLGLVVATGASLWLGTDHGFSGGDGKTLGACVVLVIAFVKVGFIGSEFMELRTAPPALRLVFQAWCAVVGGLVVVLFLAG